MSQSGSRTGQKRLVALAFVLALGGACQCPAWATEAQAGVEGPGAAVSADIATLESAYVHFKLLTGRAANERLGEDAREEARSALAAFGDVDADELAARIVMARLARIADMADGNRRGADAEAARGLVDVMTDPGRRIATIAAIGRALAAAGDATNADADVRRLLDEADGTGDAALRASAILAAAEITGTAHGFASGEVDSILPLVADLPVRAGLLARLAKAELEKAGRDDFAAAALILAARSHLRAGDAPNALVLAAAAHAVDPDADINALLSEIAGSLLDTSRIALVLRAADLTVDTLARDRLLTEVIDRLTARGELLRATPIAAAIADRRVRADRYRALALALNKQGLATAADDAFETALAAGDTSEVRGAIVQALALAGRLDRAHDLALAMTPGGDRSHALAFVAKELADAGRVDTAEALLPEIDAERDRAIALRGIGRAAAKTGDLTRAEDVVSQLVPGSDRDRVLAAVAAKHADNGDIAKARTLAAETSDRDAAVDLLLGAARRAAKAGFSDRAPGALDDALAIAEHEGSAQDARIASVATAMADIGEIERAVTLLGRIADRLVANDVRAAIVAGLGRADRLKGAYAALDRIDDPAARDRAVADLVLDDIRSVDDLGPAMTLVTAIADDRLRRDTLHAIARQTARKADLLGVLDGATSGNEAPTAPIGLSALRAASNGLELATLTGKPKRFRNMQLPDLDGAADAVRAALPLAGNAVVTLAITRDDAYFAKFFEDLRGGHSGMETTMTAQGLAAPRYILISRGVVNLGALTGRFADLVTRDGDVVTIKAPIHVGPDATLVIAGADAGSYHLSADDGAFISNAGRLFVVDTQVTGWKVSANAPALHASKTYSHNFRPFIVSWSGSTLNVAGSHLTALGYHAPKSFGLSITAGPSPILKEHGDLPEPSGTIADNTFDNFEYGFYSYEARDVRLVGNEYRDSVIYAVDPHDRSHGLVIAYNTTYRTKHKHGIIVSREVDKSFIVGNVSFDNVGSGFMLDRDSVGNVIYANTAFANRQDGVSLFESACNLVLSNLLYRNDRAGIKVRNSWDVGIYHNVLTENRMGGIDGYIADLEHSPGSTGRDFELDPYYPVTTLAAGWNRIERSGAGISLAGVSGATLIGNEFRYFGRRIFTGDIEPEATSLLAGADTGKVVLSQCRPKPSDSACPLMDRGLFGDELFGRFFDATADNDCTGIDGTVQSNAFAATLNPG